MQWKWSPAVRFVTLNWLVLRLSLQPPKGASSFIHYLSLQKAVSMKIINPERRVLNMYNALVVILSKFNPPTRRKVAFEGCFVWSRKVRPFFHLFLPGLLNYRTSQICLLASLYPSSSWYLCLSPVKSFLTWFRDSIFLSSPEVSEKVDPATHCE